MQRLPGPRADAPLTTLEGEQERVEARRQLGSVDARDRSGLVVEVLALVRIRLGREEKVSMSRALGGILDESRPYLEVEQLVLVGAPHGIREVKGLRNYPEVLICVVGQGWN